MSNCNFGHILETAHLTSRIQDEKKLAAHCGSKKGENLLSEKDPLVFFFFFLHFTHYITISCYTKTVS